MNFQELVWALEDFFSWSQMSFFPKLELHLPRPLLLFETYEHECMILFLIWIDSSYHITTQPPFVRPNTTFLSHSHIMYV